MLSDILSRFRRAHPRVELNVIEDSGEYLQHLLIGGELDVAVLLTSSVHDRMALNVETLLVSPYRLWLPLGHPLGQADAISLEQMSETPLIQLMVDEIEESMRQLMAALAVKPTIAFRTRSVEAVPLQRRGIGKTDGSLLDFDIAKQPPLHTLTAMKDRPTQGAA